jgi:hypothetical protein
MRSMRWWGAPALAGVLVLGCLQPSARREGGAELALAPQIEGPGPAGAVMRLSDYRGKVVLLSFWYDG